MVDTIKNFAYSTVATAPSPATSGTSLILQTGDGSKFPPGSFTATAWPSGVIPLSSNSEIVRATVAGDTITMIRAQEGSSAQAISTGWQFAQTITANLIAELLLAFDLAGSASLAQAAAETYADTNKLGKTANLGDLSSTTQARLNLGLGTAAVFASTAFDTAGLAATEQVRALAAEALLAPLASPTFTGTPRAPTAAAATNTTQIATTAFVTAAVAAGSGGTAGVTLFNSRSGAVTLSKADVTGTGLAAADIGAAPLANPTFTGIPAAPTPATSNNSTQIATTAFVQAAIGGVGASGVLSFNSRAGAVQLSKADITGTGLAPADINAAPLASPALTGNPTAPTQASSDNSTRLASTAFVQGVAASAASAAATSAVNALGGYGSPQFIPQITQGGVGIPSSLFTSQWTRIGKLIIANASLQLTGVGPGQGNPIEINIATLPVGPYGVTPLGSPLGTYTYGVGPNGGATAGVVFSGTIVITSSVAAFANNNGTFLGVSPAIDVNPLDAVWLQLCYFST